MIRSKISVIVYIIIGLAVFGVISQLLMNPGSLFKSIFTMLIGSLLLFLVLYFLVFKNKTSSTEDKKYNQAVKQSKLKYDQHTNTTKKKIPIIKGKGKKQVPHLRVIEGNKEKKKNRATF